MKVDVVSESDVGRRRESNQDSIFVDPNKKLFIVADGMGGHLGGKEASELAVKAICENFYQKKNQEPLEALQYSFSEASRIILEESKKNKKLTGMGTTGIALYLNQNYAYIGHVGDSRVYLYNKGMLWQLTEDHSLLNEYRKQGIPLTTKTKADNVLTRSLGATPVVQTDCLFRKIVGGDVYLLCSDGLTAMLSDDDICRVIESTPQENAAHALVKEANKQGGEDNISVILIYLN